MASAARNTECVGLRISTHPGNSQDSKFYSTLNECIKDDCDLASCPVVDCMPGHALQYTDVEGQCCPDWKCVCDRNLCEEPTCEIFKVVPSDNACCKQFVCYEPEIIDNVRPKPLPKDTIVRDDKTIRPFSADGKCFYHKMNGFTTNEKIYR